jgi:hypothetical protein
MGEWHVIRTKVGAEERVAIGLEASGMPTYLPVEMVRTSYRRRSEMRWRPAFPQHLLAMFEPAAMERVLEVSGVDDVVKSDGKLASVDADVVTAIRSAERRGLFDAAGDCRRPNGDAPPQDPRHAGLVRRIRSSRYSRERTALLMSLLASR